MNKNKLVSICIPVFNGRSFIRESVESVLGQTYPSLEVLIQDNASTDGTWEVVCDLVKKDKRIFAERNLYNVGMAPNWNKVVSRASGDFVMLLSVDDSLLPNFIEKCLEIFSRDPLVDAVSSDHYVLENGCRRKRKVKIREGVCHDFSDLIMLLNPFSINFSLFRKKTVEELSKNGNFFNPDYFTCDYDLWYRLSENCKKIYYLNKPLGIYRVHGRNLSSNKRKMNRQAFLVLLSHRKHFNFSLRLLFKLTNIRFLIRVLINYVRSGIMDKKFIKILVKEFFCRF
ncbi:MAG: hypothetical protein Fur0012_08090 [Elusimicrobiota bacterium]